MTQHLILNMGGLYLPININNVAEPDPDPGIVAIPQLAGWESNMIFFADYHGDLILDGATYYQNEECTYYDGQRVYQQISDYTGNTGDVDYDAVKEQVQVLWHNYLVGISSPYGCPGFWNFSEGFTRDWLDNGDASARADVVGLSDGAMYSREEDPVSLLTSYDACRECSYTIQTYINEYRCGYAINPRVHDMMALSLGHIDTIVNDVPDNFQPFMFALTAKGLIHYWNYVAQDPDILTKIQAGADYIWANCWRPAYAAFYLIKNQADPSIGAPDLNLLIAPLFSWLYYQTGNTTYRDHGDEVFAGGVTGAYLYGNQGKTFNQNYQWSFDYLTYRAKAENTYTETAIAPLDMGASSVGLVDGLCAPRFKMAYRAGYDNILYAIHGSSYTDGSVWISLNSGANWATLGTQVARNYHMCLDADGDGRVFIAGVNYDGDAPAIVQRWNGTSWDSAITLDDFGGTVSVANVCVGNGNDVFAFVRPAISGYGVYWHRSTDNGATFGAGTNISDWGTVGTIRVGSAWISGQPVILVGYSTAGIYRYRFFRWDGTDSFDALANDSFDTVASEAIRRWSVAELENGQLHCVYMDDTGSNYCLRHRYRSLTGTWSDAVTVHDLNTADGTDEGPLCVSHVGNTLCLAYVDLDTTLKIFYRTWTAAGGWSAATQLSTGSGNCGHPNTAREINGQSWPVMYAQGTKMMFSTVVVV